jgi:hypothetical protein
MVTGRKRNVVKALLDDFHPSLIFNQKDGKGDAMTTFLSRELREGLAAAHKLAQKRKSRLRIDVDGKTYPVLRVWDGGFAMDLEDAPHLRGLVDLYDGGRHLSHCLIFASEEREDEMWFDFKRSTPVTDHAALDFARDEHAPVALITRD